MAIDLTRRAVAEALGTAGLLAAVVGSGIMGERLAGGNVAVALLANSLATGGALLAIISALQPISGAHLNPVVTVVDAAAGGLPWRDVPVVVAAQMAGAVLGVLAAHLMFGEAWVSWATHDRGGVAPGRQRGRRHVRAAGGDPRVCPATSRRDSRRGERLHRGGVLVHRVDLVRQSGGDRGAQPDGDLRRDPDRRRRAIRRRPAGRRRRRPSWSCAG